MRKALLAIVFLASCSLLVAQQALTNDSVIKLVKAGLSDDLIVSTINASPGTYDTSANGLIALKSAKASDKVVTAIVTKATAPAPAALPPVTPLAPLPATANPSATGVQAPAAPTAGKPRVFLTSASKGPNRNAARDQSMEMSKDFERDCPDIRISINQQAADYTVALNHIEIGLFVRDNQFQVANKDGDLISTTKEGGSIAGGVKKACAVILADWSKK
jgi:hypothetical protein